MKATQKGLSKLFTQLQEVETIEQEQKIQSNIEKFVKDSKVTEEEFNLAAKPFLMGMDLIYSDFKPKGLEYVVFYQGGYFD